MIKKYLTTPEEILALRDTDTEIHYGYDGDFIMRFVQGILCTFTKNGKLYGVNVDIHISQNPYILVEEPVKEATEKDIGKLCKFIRKDGERISILVCFTNNKRPVAVGGDIFDKCYRLTPAEVAEITGYKVEEV